jgi:hypothetical protein
VSLPCKVFLQVLQEEFGHQWMPGKFMLVKSLRTSEYVVYRKFSVLCYNGKLYFGLECTYISDVFVVICRSH